MFTVTKTSQFGFSWVTLTDLDSAVNVADVAKFFCPDTEVEVWEFDEIVYKPNCLMTAF